MHQSIGYAGDRAARWWAGLQALCARLHTRLLHHALPGGLDAVCIRAAQGAVIIADLARATVRSILRELRTLFGDALVSDLGVA